MWITKHRACQKSDALHFQRRAWFSSLDRYREYWRGHCYEPDDVYVDYFDDGCYLFTTTDILAVLELQSVSRPDLVRATGSR